MGRREVLQSPCGLLFFNGRTAKYSWEIVRSDAVELLFDAESVFGAWETAKVSCAGVLCHRESERHDAVTQLFDADSVREDAMSDKSSGECLLFR
jgi:hypothetical protein